MPRIAPPTQRRVSLANEFRESSRVGPRVWALVGVALTLVLIIPQLIWVALGLWLVFVFPLAMGGVIRWAMAELVRSASSQTVAAPRPSSRTERTVSGRVIS